MRKLVLPGIVTSVLGIAIVYASAFLPGGGPSWAPWLMMVSVATLMVATMALGAARFGQVGKLKLTFALVWLILVTGFALALALPAETVTEPRLLFGLPLRTAIVLYGIGLVPLFVVPIAYAVTFDSLTLSEDDLARLRGAARTILDAEHRSTEADVDVAYAESGR